jgi:hypothetical protein
MIYLLYYVYYNVHGRKSNEKLRKTRSRVQRTARKGCRSGSVFFPLSVPYTQSACTNSSPCTCTALINLNLFVFVGGCVMFLLPKEDFKISYIQLKYSEIVCIS